MSEQVIWERDEDGEYNEIVAMINGHDVHVFSDRDAESWDYVIDDRESVCGYKNRQEAKQAATDNAQRSMA